MYCCYSTIYLMDVLLLLNDLSYRCTAVTQRFIVSGSTQPRTDCRTKALTASCWSTATIIIIIIIQAGVKTKKTNTALRITKIGCNSAEENDNKRQSINHERGKSARHDSVTNNLCICMVKICRSQWPRHLRHVLSSPAQTLGSLVNRPRNPIDCL
jgi:hypothetical protein